MSDCSCTETRAGEDELTIAEDCEVRIRKQEARGTTSAGGEGSLLKLQSSAAYMAGYWS